MYDYESLLCLSKMGVIAHHSLTQILSIHAAAVLEILGGHYDYKWAVSRPSIEACRSYPALRCIRSPHRPQLVIHGVYTSCALRDQNYHI